MNKNVIKSAIVLTLIGIFCGLLIGLANYITAPIIQENRVKAARIAYEGFFPELTNLEIKEVDGKYTYEYVKVIGSEGVIGHAFRAKTNNQRGLVDIVVAATAEGAIKGIKILETGNTPGYFDNYENNDGNLIGVKGGTITDLSGINNISGATQTGDSLNAMIKEVGELASVYIDTVVELNEYESLFGVGSVGVVDEEFTGDDIVTSKSLVYDEDENLIGLTYTGTITVLNRIPGKQSAELTIVVGIDFDGEVKGIYELVNEHTQEGRYDKYYDAIDDLNGIYFEDLNINSEADASISAEVLNDIFDAITVYASKDIPSRYEKIFGVGVVGIKDEDFISNELVKEKVDIYDEDENLVGYVYQATHITTKIPRKDTAELTLMIGVNTDGTVKGILHVVSGHTAFYYNNYLEALENLSGVEVENLEISKVAGSTISYDVLTEIFNAVKEVILNE